MACPIEKNYGYESCRFEKDVDEHLHCSICHNVLKEPRTCINNEHIFCLACITGHLTENSQTCPECNEHLTVDTLRRPRVVNNILSNLKIKCDYASRGCPEFVRVEELQTHVENCDFVPVLCSNDECGMEINKQDKVHHETEVCEYRKVTSRDFRKIQERLEGNLTVLDGKVVEIKEEIQDARKDIKDVKENLSKVNKDVDEIKVTMSQMLEKLNTLKRLNKLPSPTEKMINTPREDILIAGGEGPSTNVGESTEMYSWEKNGWFKMSKMNKERDKASSFIHKDHLFVVGGYNTKTIETLNVNELPWKWTEFADELPYGCYNQQTVVCQQRIIHFAGYRCDECEYSKAISELQLSSPCTLKELGQMPEPRQGHGAEIFEDKILILGGENERESNVLDSVLKFDVMKNELTEMPPLPHALRKMATVRWRDEVIVLGGKDEDDDILNDVFMYECKTGKITTLPSMLEKRCACCAVITGNTIVVMGGKDDNDETLKTVECFTMGGSTWEYLPAMRKARRGATAAVLPSTRKYV